MHYQVFKVDLNWPGCESNFLVTLPDRLASGLVIGPVPPLTFGATVPNDKAA